MRAFACLLALAAATSTVHAEDDDPDFVAFPKLAFGLGLQGHATRIGGRSEGGVGPLLELAHGRDRWQYFIEGSVASSGYDNWAAGENPSLDEMRYQGHMWRGAAGARWLARQFELDRSGGIELFLQSQVGVQRLRFEERKLTRPELAFAVGIQGRGYRRPRIGFRLDARMLFTPNDGEGELVTCRVACMNESGSSLGFLTGITFIW